MSDTSTDTRKYITVWIDDEGHSELDTNILRPEEINWWLDVGKSIIFQKSFITE